MPVVITTARLEARISTDLHSMLKRAAEIQGRTMTDFVVSAVQDAAQHQAGIVFEEVNEAWSTQMCSRCGSVEGPKGQAELDIREWTCSCDAHHDRDVNAAMNIRAKGLAQFAISKAAEARACEPVLNELAGSIPFNEAGHGLPAGGIPFL